MGYTVCVYIYIYTPYHCNIARVRYLMRTGSHRFARILFAHTDIHTCLPVFVFFFRRWTWQATWPALARSDDPWIKRVRRHHHRYSWTITVTSEQWYLSKEPSKETLYYQDNFSQQSGWYIYHIFPSFHFSIFFEFAESGMLVSTCQFQVDFPKDYTYIGSQQVVGLCH